MKVLRSTMARSRFLMLKYKRRLILFGLIISCTVLLPMTNMLVFSWPHQSSWLYKIYPQIFSQQSRLYHSEEEDAFKALTCHIIGDDLNEHKRYILSNITSESMTVDRCRQYCGYTVSSSFMTIFNGSECWCSNQFGYGLVTKDSDCKTTCSGNSSQRCGGRNAAVTYRLDKRDGDESWSAWMSYSIVPGSRIRSRYSGCKRRDNQHTSCVVTLDKTTESMKNGTGQDSDSPIDNYYIGCFTSKSFHHESIKQHSKWRTKDPSECIQFCQGHSTVYSALLPRDKLCVCIDSLGWSQPSDTCMRKLGAVVFSNQPITGNIISLKFEKRLTEHLVAVVAHFRGGSTVASAMFNIIPGALAVYEPGVIEGKSWPDVTLEGQEYERSQVFLQKFYHYWFDCQSQNIPLVFYRTYQRWGKTFNFGLSELISCLDDMPVSQDVELCAPILRETCLMSPIVAAKTVRVLNSEALERFILQRPDIKFIHAIRDPRATLASRGRIDSWYTKGVLEKLAGSCWELNQLYPVFEGDKHPANTYIVRYEDIAANTIKTAAALYRRLSIPFSADMRKQLEQMSGRGNATRSNAFDVIQSNPKSRINNWIKHLPHDSVRRAEKTPECSELFNIYSQYYKPLDDLIHPKFSSY